MALSGGVALCGTEDAPPVPVELKDGPLSTEVDAGALRAVRWHGVEVVRGISLLVRDENWGTFGAEDPVEEFADTDAGFRYLRRFSVANGSLDCRLQVDGSAEGTLVALARIEAREAVVTNRAGFVVLHPLHGVAGQKALIRTPEGETVPSRFPDRISPSQPMMNMAGLEHEIGGVRVSIGFDGDVFEMEDQRNWSDASYKTYCRPLEWPRPYRLEAGDAVEQRVVVRVEGTPAKALGMSGGAVGVAPTPVPGVALALDASSPLDADLCALMSLIGFSGLQLRLEADTAEVDLETVRPLLDALDCPLHLEIVLSDTSDAAAALEQVAEACARHSLDPARTIALPAAYLKSHQPTGPWPAGDTPIEVSEKVRRIFPHASIGGGMLTNFTELNRCPPDPGRVDFVTHGSTAIVHAADDRSVMETLEALPAIFRSAADLAGRKPLHLGLFSIGARTNPYGEAVTPNPGQHRLELARSDPRQRGLFAAAFAISVVAATAGTRVQDLALGMPCGAFGLVDREEAWARPFYDTASGERVYPLFHALRALTDMAGQPRVAYALGNPRVAVVATGNAAILANHSAVPLEIGLPEAFSGMAVRVLDEGSFEAATADADWLISSAAAPLGNRLRLRPYATAYISPDRDAP